MKLLVDVGNSRAKWMLRRKGEILQRGALPHQGLDHKQLGKKLWGDIKRPDEIYMVNVAGADIADDLCIWLREHWDLTPHFVFSEEENFGVRNAYRTPRQLGVDRWVAMIGARSLSETNCCVIDCGTAITVDALRADGVHLGGVIFPGTRLMRQALYRNTRQIYLEDEGEMTLFGTNTRDGVWSGTTYAAAAAIDTVTRRMEQVMGTPVKRFLTGGNSRRLLTQMQQEYQHEPDLIFTGLQTIAETGRTFAGT